MARLVSSWTLVVLCFCTSAFSSDPNTIERASGLVGEAIAAEINGELLNRHRFLSEALQVDSSFAPARWFRGQVRSDQGDWMTIEESIDQGKSNKLLSQYEAIHYEQQPTVLGNWQAAQWCAKNNLAPQCRAHLENILMFEHDNEVARIRTCGSHQYNSRRIVANIQSYCG